MKKPSTRTLCRNGQLTIGLDLGDRLSCYCILSESGEVIVSATVATSPEAMRKTFRKMPRSRIALETGTHSPRVSRVLTELGHEAIVAHSRNVRLIGESRQKDDRLDAQALARLARIDPQLLSPIQHRSAQAQADLSVIRARYGLIRASRYLRTRHHRARRIGHRSSDSSSEILRRCQGTTGRSVFCRGVASKESMARNYITNLQDTHLRNSPPRWKCMIRRLAARGKLEREIVCAPSAFSLQSDGGPYIFGQVLRVPFSTIALAIRHQMAPTLARITHSAECRIALHRREGLFLREARAR